MHADIALAEVSQCPAVHVLALPLPTTLACRSSVVGLFAATASRPVAVMLGRRCPVWAPAEWVQLVSAVECGRAYAADLGRWRGLDSAQIRRDLADALDIAGDIERPVRPWSVERVLKRLGAVLVEVSVGHTVPAVLRS